MSDTLFEQAARGKIRFETTRGSLSTEDLWDLPLISMRGLHLDEIAIGLFRELKDYGTESFVQETPTGNEALQLKFAIVKHVIDVKKAEQQERKAQVERATRKAKLLEILARKQDAVLETMPMEDLERMVAEL